MPPKLSLVQGSKRSRDGNQRSSHLKASRQSHPQNDTPPCAQPTGDQTSSSKSPSEGSLNHSKPANKQQIPVGITTKPSVPTHPSTKPTNRKIQKRPTLPDNATISKRPLFHPAIPTPYSSSQHPKTLYIKPGSPFIPTVKRIRTLLREIEKRRRQSLAAQKRSGLGSRDPLRSDGRLDPKVVERAIAEGSEDFGAGLAKGRGGGIGAEEVFVKASGKAIPRALEIGNWFQKEGDCGVRVEIGSVSAIDDIGVVEVDDEAEGEGKGEERDEDAMDVDGVEDTRNNKRKRKSGRIAREEDIPETRIRTLSTVTVAISLT